MHTPCLLWPDSSGLLFRGEYLGPCKSMTDTLAPVERTNCALSAWNPTLDRNDVPSAWLYGQDLTSVYIIVLTCTSLCSHVCTSLYSHVCTSLCSHVCTSLYTQLISYATALMQCCTRSRFFVKSQARVEQT